MKERFINRVGETTKIIYPSVEEMDCSSCEATTGHRIQGSKWICIPCEEQKSKKDKK